METKTIVESQQSLEISAIKRGLQRIGLSLSEAELQELNLGNTISLEGIGLGEIGSIFILASAVSAVNLGKPRQSITYQDLPKAVQDSACCSGISIYCWDSATTGKRCLHLTLIDGKPAVRTCHICPI